MNRSLLPVPAIALWLGAFQVIAPGQSLEAQTPFLDPIYATTVTTGVEYGTGTVRRTAPLEVPLVADLYKPTGPGLPSRLPGFVVIHGGGFTGGSRQQAQIVQLCQAYAKRGYVTLSIDYRLAGDDPPFEPGPTPGADARQRSMNAAAQDAAKAVRWLRANAASLGLDPGRIAIGGGSAGAITSLYAGHQETDTLGEGAGVSAILDLWGGMYGREDLIDADDPPVFVCHGTEDETVPFAESERLVARLGQVGVDHRFFPMSGAGHGAWTPYFNALVEGKTIDRHCAEFFFRSLRLAEIHPGAAAPTSVVPGGAPDSLTVSITTDSTTPKTLGALHD